MAEYSVEDNRVFDVDDLSCAFDSGWRELDEQRVAELTQAFKQGDFGQTTLSAPTALGGRKKDSEEMKLLESSVDGKYRLNNGKSTIAALQQLKKERAAAIAEATAEAMVGSTDSAEPEWATGRLLRVLKEGLRMDVVVYQAESTDSADGSDPLLLMAVNAMQHDADQNKYRVTSLAMKVKIVESVRARVQGGDWKATLQGMLDIYGKSKRRTVSRWISVAQNMEPGVLALFKENRRVQQLSQNLIWDNRYILGGGEEKRFKLSTSGCEHAIMLALDRMEARQVVDREKFMTDFCAPCKAVEANQPTNPPHPLHSPTHPSSQPTSQPSSQPASQSASQPRHPTRPRGPQHQPTTSPSQPMPGDRSHGPQDAERLWAGHGELPGVWPRAANVVDGEWAPAGPAMHE